MILYFALIIPFLIGAISKFIWHKKVKFWEMVLPFVICLGIIPIIKSTSEGIADSDTEYRSSLFISAKYYESWSTYIKRTCTRSYKCGKSTCHTTYDCSYCDYNEEYYVAIDNYGNSYSIDKRYYNYLIKRWKSTPKFIELNRDINYHYSCGKDGDMYEIEWNKDPLTSKVAVKEYRYENRLLIAHNVFHYDNIDHKQADKLGLYQYPNIVSESEPFNTSEFRQPVILGIEKLGYSPAEIRYINTRFEYLNGILGINKHAKIFILLFYNQSIKKAFEQESYWYGGNQNELVVCIDVDPKSKKLNYVKCFSWCEKKRILLDIREDIMNHEVFSIDNIYNTIYKYTYTEWKRADFKTQFDWIPEEVPTGAIWFTYILVIIVSIFIIWWSIENDL